MLGIPTYRNGNERNKSEQQAEVVDLVNNIPQGRGARRCQVRFYADQAGIQLVSEALAIEAAHVVGPGRRNPRGRRPVLGFPEFFDTRVRSFPRGEQQ